MNLWRWWSVVWQENPLGSLEWGLINFSLEAPRDLTLFLEKLFLWWGEEDEHQAQHLISLRRNAEFCDFSLPRGKTCVANFTGKPITHLQFMPHSQVIEKLFCKAGYKVTGIFILFKIKHSSLMWEPQSLEVSQARLDGTLGTQECPPRAGGGMRWFLRFLPT